MTAHQRLEQDLPRLLAQLAEGPRPDYRDSLVEATARTPQRAAWTFPGRWLPMDITATRVQGTPRPLRSIVVLVVLGLLVAAAALALVGASQRRVPAPFGPAANGILVFGNEGDLYAMNADGSAPRPLLADPATHDSDPLLSPLGDQLTFAREVEGAWELWLVDDDGGDVRRLTDPLVGLGAYSWAPDGSQIAAHHRVAGLDTVTLFATDGSGSRDLALPFRAGDPVWRPGHDGQLLVRTQGAPLYDLYVVDVETGAATKLDLPHEEILARQYDGQRPDWSPDGTRLLVEQGLARYSEAGRMVIRLRVLDVDAAGNVSASRLLERDPGADYEYGAVWLTTGAGFGFGVQAGCEFQVYVTHGEDMVGATPVGEPIDDCTNRGVGLSLSPDGTRALTTRTGDGGDVMSIGGVDGAGRVRLNVTTTDAPTWQRLAP